MRFEFASVNNVVDHSMLQQELGALKIFWKFLPDSLFNHSWASKADQGFWLSNDHIAKHREAGGHSACGWIS